MIAVPLDVGLNPGGDMHDCKYIVPSRHGGTLNSRRAASHLERLVEGKERWFKEFCSGHNSLYDKENTGRPRPAMIPDNDFHTKNANE
ncbi:hypothetical protein TNCV_4160181 [Trichonephila clavipes]|nr:hypothetical protein TNCV_4160181 [Trichonephila clavipes]